MDLNLKGAALAVLLCLLATVTGLVAAEWLFAG